MILALQLAGGYSFAQIAVAVVVACILIGIVLIVAKVCEINIPWWFWAILGLIALGVIAIAAIRIVASM